MPIVISIGPDDLSDLEWTTSIVFDSAGSPLDDYLKGLCVDIENGRVQVRWGEGYGDYFVKWPPPFSPIQFEAFGRSHQFCLEGQEDLPAEVAEVTS